MKEIKTNYFFGNEVSAYGIEHGYVDYKTLARAFDSVLVNDITKLFFAEVNGEDNEPELINGNEFDEDENPIEIYQYYIISDSGARILENFTNEIVYYLPLLDCYVWGVTHYGTSWDYVLTDIKINKEV